MAAHLSGIVAGRQDDRAQPTACGWWLGHVDTPRDGIELIGQYVLLKELPINLSVIKVPDQCHVFRTDQLSLHLTQRLRALDSTLQQAGVVRGEHHKAVLQRWQCVFVFALQLASVAVVLSVCHAHMLVPWATRCVGVGLTVAGLTHIKDALCVWI